MGMLAHLSALVTIGPLIIWLMNKDQPDKSFVTNNAKEALNLVISLWIVMVPVWIVAYILVFVPVIGWIIDIVLWLLMMAVGIAGLVFIIMAAMKANEGVEYRYPFALRLIK
ncbi:MAG: DUF4870 domain-containing protein [Proteobacteria bacterium]|nr:DUF4870 domain-containing protein [Pseudomonadota bacterium]